MENYFNLENKLVVITGGAGLLGQKHAEAVANFGANPVIVDIDDEGSQAVAKRIANEYGVDAKGYKIDLTQEESVRSVTEKIIGDYGKIDILINNAANNPVVSASGGVVNGSRLENFDLSLWNKDIEVGVTGAFLCSKYMGFEISKNPKGGSIINISSDLGLIAPNQFLYAKPELDFENQPVKPVTYSVVKSALIGLTRYLATYWAEKNVRCNALCPGGVYNGQEEQFVKKVSQLIPMGRMANSDEYQGAIVFLCSDASSYMNGSILSIDGGRTCW